MEWKIYLSIWRKMALCPELDYFMIPIFLRGAFPMPFLFTTGGPFYAAPLGKLVCHGRKIKMPFNFVERHCARNWIIS